MLRGVGRGSQEPVRVLSWQGSCTMRSNSSCETGGRGTRGLASLEGLSVELLRAEGKLLALSG